MHIKYDRDAETVYQAGAKRKAIGKLYHKLSLLVDTLSLPQLVFIYETFTSLLTSLLLQRGTMLKLTK